MRNSIYGIWTVVALVAGLILLGLAIADVIFTVRTAQALGAVFASFELWTRLLLAFTCFGVALTTHSVELERRAQT